MRKLEEKTLYSGNYRSIVEKTFESQDGVISNFEVLTWNGVTGNAVCALDEQGNFVMVKQFCAGPEEFFLNLPGGGAEQNETPIETARRELLEETGYEAGTLELIGGFYADVFCEGYVNCFLARECKRKYEQKLDSAEEGTEVVLKSRRAMIEELSSGHILPLYTACLLMGMGKIDGGKS